MEELLEELKLIKLKLEEQNILKKEVLNMDEACLYTGRSKANMYKLTSGNYIPHYKPEGKMIFFKRSELDKWLLRNPVKTISEIESEAETRVVLS